MTPCSCRVESRYDKPYIKDRVIFCPLHAKAPEMAELLRVLVVHSCLEKQSVEKIEKLLKEIEG